MRECNCWCAPLAPTSTEDLVPDHCFSLVVLTGTRCSIWAHSETDMVFTKWAHIIQNYLTSKQQCVLLLHGIFLQQILHNNLRINQYITHIYHSTNPNKYSCKPIQLNYTFSVIKLRMFKSGSMAC